MSKYKYWRQTFFNFIDKDNKSFLKVYFGESLCHCVCPTLDSKKTIYFITFFILHNVTVHYSMQKVTYVCIPIKIMERIWGFQCLSWMRYPKEITPEKLTLLDRSVLILLCHKFCGSDFACSVEMRHIKSLIWSGSRTTREFWSCTFIFSWSTPSYFANQVETFRKITLWQ